MKQLGNRISFKNYPKIIQQKSRRTLLEQTKQIGKNIIELPTTRDKNDLSTVQSSNNKPRKTVLRIRSISVNGTRKIEPQKQITNQYQKSILNTLLKQDVVFNLTQKTITDSNSQNNFQMKFRILTIDWIIDIHNRLKLEDQTLFLFLIYFDEYCHLAQVSKSKLRNIAITCLWIAAKFQQMYPPKLDFFLNIAFDITDRYQMKMLQMDILEKLNYNLIKTTPLQLLNIVQGKRKGTQDESLCKYIFQLCYAFGLNLYFKASTMVIVALSFVQHVYRHKTQFKKYQQQFCVTKQNLVQSFKQICLMLQKSKNQVNITALKAKYNKPKNHEVSKLKLEIKDPFIINF